MQRLVHRALIVLVLLSAARLRAADMDSSGGTSGSSPSTPAEMEVIGRPEGVAPANEPTGPGGPGTTSVFNGTMFQSPPVQGYRVESSTTGTLIDVPFIDLAATVAVVPQALLVDQQVLGVDNLLQDVPGAVKVSDPRRPDAFFLRGFQVTSRDYRKNGFLDPTYTPRDFANVDRVEILEGPCSAVYGAGQPSGTVNLITKQPLPEWRQEGSIQAGSFGLQRYTIDSNGPVYEDRSLLYRVIADYQTNDSFRDFGYNESGSVAPSLAWVIDRDTTLTWQGEFVTDRQRYDSGVAAVNGRLDLPRSRFLGEPTDFQHFQDYRESLVLDHRINSDWSVKVGGSSLFYNSESSGTVPAGELSNGDIYRTRQDIGPFVEQYQSVMATLAGNVEIGRRMHHLVFGTEEGWFTSNAFVGISSYPGVDPLSIDPWAPNYGNVPQSIAPAEIFASKFYQADYGFYFQDLIDVTTHWKLLAGVRYDRADVVFDRELSFLGYPVISAMQSAEHYDVISPRVGLICEPVPEQVSLYCTYSTSFDPPDGGPYIETAPLQPEFGQMWEWGCKVKATDQLKLAAAVFHINKENVAIYRSDGYHIAQVGGQRSDGLELSALGNLTDHLSLVANYSYTDTQLTDPSQGSAINGQRAFGVPYNLASIWSRYNLIAAPRHTFGVGLGLAYVGDRPGDYASSFVLPSYTRCDAGVYYQRNRLDVNLFVENLFDKVYYVSSINQYEGYPGAPINVKGQMTLRY